MKQSVLWIIVFAVALFSVSLAIKGEVSSLGLRYQYDDYTWDVGGPFETSGSRARYALTESIVTRQSFILSPEETAFAAPDVSGFVGNYYSIFAPGVSLLALPLYVIGQIFKVPQIGAFFLNTLLILVDAFLIYRVARKIGTSTIPAVISGLAFLLCSNALTYSGSFTQHLAVTMVVLTSLLISASPASIVSAASLGIITGWGMLFDLPAMLMLSPALIAYFSSALNLTLTAKKISFNLNPNLSAFIFALVPLIILFMIYNLGTTGQPFTVAQFIGRPAEFQSLSSTASSSANLALPYLPRSLIDGLHTLVIGDERGLLLYFPLSVFAIAGLIYSLRHPSTRTLAGTAFFVILINIVSYGMFGDPWGGWSYGPRYLIPATAVLSAFIGVALEKIYSQLLIFFFIVISYFSVFLSFLGALTTSQVPPVQEARSLIVEIPHTPLYNWQLLSSGNTGSLFYQLFFSEISPVYFYLLISLIVGTIFVGLYIVYLRGRNYEN